MKFNVKPEEILGNCFGYLLLYPMGENFDRNPDRKKNIETIIAREPVQVVPTHDEEKNFHYFEYDAFNYHLGVFDGKKPEFLIWLQETYLQIPEAAKYLFK